MLTKYLIQWIQITMEKSHLKNSSIIVIRTKAYEIPCLTCLKEKFCQIATKSSSILFVKSQSPNFSNKRPDNIPIKTRVCNSIISEFSKETHWHDEKRGKLTFQSWPKVRESWVPKLAPKLLPKLVHKLAKVERKLEKLNFESWPKVGKSWVPKLAPKLPPKLIKS